MTRDEELKLRILGAEMILEAGYSLKVPWFAISTSQAIFHRFYLRYLPIILLTYNRASFLDYDLKDIVMASLFIGTKLEEHPRKVRDIVSVLYHVIKVIFSCYSTLGQKWSQKTNSCTRSDK